MKAPDRLRAIDWARIAAELDSGGNAVLEQLISPAECEQLAALYADDSRFRSRVVRARAASIASTYGTASAGSAAASAMPPGSSFTTPLDRRVRPRRR
jgi:hypothetical protein